MQYAMEGEDGTLDLTATGPFTAVSDSNSTCTNTRADTHSCTLRYRYLISCLDTFLYHVIHQPYVKLLLFVVSRWETAKLCAKTDLDYM